MNRFLRIIIPIGLVALISAYPLHRFISYLLRKSNEFPSEFEVMNDIYEGKAAAEIAIYGSSRAWVHIDPQVIEDTLGMSSYNFGNDGHNFPMQYLRHKETAAGWLLQIPSKYFFTISAAGRISLINALT